MNLTNHDILQRFSLTTCHPLHDRFSYCLNKTEAELARMLSKWPNHSALLCHRNCGQASRKHVAFCLPQGRLGAGLYYQVKGLTAVKPRARFRRGTYVGRCRANYLQQLTQCRASAALGMEL
jgi:hypothetical protein